MSKNGLFWALCGGKRLLWMTFTHLDQDLVDCNVRRAFLLWLQMDVYCFLFTDMLLITKPTAKRGEKVKVIKPPMRLDKIVVHSLRDVGKYKQLSRPILIITTTYNWCRNSGGSRILCLGS